jgi:DNA polymerase-3 subunit alpha
MTTFSALDGLNTAEEYMIRAKELGMTHLAQTNHGTLAGHRSFQLAAKDAGIVPILGLEAYYSVTDRFDKRANASRTDGTSVYNHIIILAQNERGLENLNALSEKAWTEGYYHKPRIDFDLLSEINEDLIVLSGCLNGPVSKAIEAGDEALARQYAAAFKSVLGDRFYIEVQAENPAAINEGLLSIADKLGIKPVITGDCHYADPKDRWLEEAFLILSTNPKMNREFDMSKSQKMDMLDRFNYLYPERKMTFQEWDLFLAGREHRAEKMRAQGIDREDIYDNTNEISARIGDYPIYAGLDTLPQPKKDANELLENLCRKGMDDRGLTGKPEYEQRLQEELSIIRQKNFASYFLIVSDTLRWAKARSIAVGPGRGSAAGSLVCYTAHITDVDPIQYGLLFSRFIDPSRPDMPDVDMDIQANRRHEVQEYLQNKFPNVAKIATFTKFEGKSAIKAAARVFGIPFAEINKVTKNMETMDDYDSSPNLREFRSQYPEVGDLAKRLTGRIASTGMHAAGLVVSKEPIFKYVPVETRNDKADQVSGRTPVIGLDMNDAADIGFVKLDLLGLKTLSVLGDTIRLIKNRRGIDIDLLKLPLNDVKTYEMLSEGYTKGVFQAEGHTFTKWILETGVREFNDLVIGTSIARPGPLNTVGEIYKRRLAGKEPVKHENEIMRAITEETLGTIVYQEQVMRAMTDLGGMSMATANKVRKIIGKKRDASEFEPFRVEFVEGASKHISPKRAEQLWHDFEQHAGYSFNKSHAVAYSMVTYWTAYLKANYPLEFMTATLLNETDKDSVTEYMMDAKRLGITIRLPHLNKSELGYTIEGDAIRMGLTSIKYISEKVGNHLMKHRPFESFEHLKKVSSVKGSGINSRAVEALDRVGAAVFDDNPRRKDHRDYFYEYMGIPAFTQSDLPPKVKNQFTTLDEYSPTGCQLILAMAKGIKRGDGWARVDFMDETGQAGVFANADIEIETGNMYVALVAENRIARYMTVAELTKVDNVLSEYVFADSFPDLTDGFMRVISFQKYVTRAGKKMAYIVFSDAEKNLKRAMAFPGMYQKAFGLCIEGRTVMPTFAKTDDGSLFLKDVEL